MFSILMGVPEMEQYCTALQASAKSGKASKQKLNEYRLLCKALARLAFDPRCPGLHTHEIPSLSSRYGEKVWESYLENNTPAARRLFWAYGPGKNEITFLGIEPHPNDTKSSYRRITLSSMGEPLK